MNVMLEESFGPILSIMSVTNDDQAISLINDSKYGLTSSLWSNDINTCLALAKDIEVGTVFLNRCDYLDPELVWTGRKNTGNGISLSKYAFNTITQFKVIILKKTYK